MTIARAIRLTEFGGPEVMRLETVDVPDPAAGEVQLRQTAIGFNFIDVYQRMGRYPLPSPTGLGYEAAGVVEVAGEGVIDLKAGDRVVYMNAGVGAYAERRNVPADKLVVLPAGVSDEAAAAVFFKAMTAQFLIRKTHAVKAGDTIVVHAAAGGVGQILCRWAKTLGATVIGTAGSDAKCEAALRAGCDVAVNYTQADWVEQVIAATGGRKARVVYDSVGKDTFLGSLDCTAPFGLVVLFGGASGPAGGDRPRAAQQEGLPVPDAAVGLPPQRRHGHVPRERTGCVRCNGAWRGRARDWRAIPSGPGCRRPPGRASAGARRRDRSVAWLDAREAPRRAA